jgi:hypothetical protein
MAFEPTSTLMGLDGPAGNCSSRLIAHNNHRAIASFRAVFIGEDDTYGDPCGCDLDSRCIARNPLYTSDDDTPPLIKILTPEELINMGYATIDSTSH